jgi:predicted O-methyltransferase YrrM
MVKPGDAVVAEARGFMKSRVILTAAELGLFTRLDERPCRAEELALEKGFKGRATTRVLDCLVTLGLVDKRDGVYQLTESGALYSSHHAETILPMVLHMNRLWDTWSNLTEVVKTGGHAERESGIQMGEEDWKAFIGAMHVVGRELAQIIASEYDLGRFRRLLDIGGGSGTYTIAFLQQNPDMTAVIYDLEHVIPMAKARLADEGIEDRTDLVVGDFYKDELPKGCDLAFLSAIIHQNGPEENLELYRKIYKALEPGGAVLIRDYLMDKSRTVPPAGAMFAINMLVNTRAGDTYTFEEVRAQLEEVGFTEVKQMRICEGMDCLVEGQKPA